MCVKPSGIVSHCHSEAKQDQLKHFLYAVYLYLYTVFQKNVTLCESLAKYYPVSIIFGGSIPEEICNKSMYVCPPHLFTVLIPYLVKIMIHLPVLTLF